MERSSRLEVTGLTVVLGSEVVLADVSLRFRSGEIATILGSSGSGKTTLLRTIAGVQPWTSGAVELDDEPVRPGAVRMAMQDDPLFEHLDVSGNLGFVQDLERRPLAEREKTVRTTAQWMGIRRVLDHRPRQLSGGERAAASVGRSITAIRKPFLLFDEPLARADGRRRLAFFRRLRSIVGDPSRTPVGVVVATNEPEIVLPFSDRVVVMSGGRVLQWGSVEEVTDRPTTVEVAELATEPAMNLIPATLIGDGSTCGGDVLVVWTDRVVPNWSHRPLHGPVVLGIRPGEFRPASPGTPFQSVLHVCIGGFDIVNRIARFGLGATPGTVYAMATAPGERYRRGDRIEITWSRYRIFRADTGELVHD